MADYRLSWLAESDYDDLAVYTIETWGEAQADRYLAQLEECFLLVADRPGIGRPCDWLMPGLRRIEHGSHVIFFREEAGGVLIARILHQRMMPNPHLFREAGA